MTRARVYLDTNVFILGFEAVDPLGDAARRLFRAVDRGVIDAATSELTLAEVLVKPLRDGDTGLAAAYRPMIEPGGRFLVVPVVRQVLEDAAGLRARHPSLKLPDAIHLATAAEAGCTTVVSRDRSLAPFSALVPVSDLDGETVDQLIERPA